MPPSAGAWKTIDAELRPDCGRAGPRSSIITAIGWRAAAAGLTSSPVSADATSTGLGLGLGLGDGDGLGTIVGLGAIDADGDALAAAATVLEAGTVVVGEQPTSMTAAAIASPTSQSWRSRPI